MLSHFADHLKVIRGVKAELTLRNATAKGESSLNGLALKMSCDNYSKRQGD
jgi:hypothetical protein